MLLEEFFGDPTGAYIKAERYVNEGSISGLSEANTTSPRTRPRSAFPSFALPQIRFSEEVLLEDLGEGSADYIEERCMFVHPDMLDANDLRDDGLYTRSGAVMVAPTASGRTVVALGRGYFVKLAYLGYLGRLFRHLNREMILSACEVTKQLVAAVHSNKANAAFAILPENRGRVAHIPIDRCGNGSVKLPLNGRDCYEWGVLFREGRPYPHVEPQEVLIPCFALVSAEHDPATGVQRTSQDKPLLVQLFEKQSRSIEEFLLEKILFPLFQTYFDALLLAGVELEAHAQNTLLTVDAQGTIQRVVCRDFESAGRDVPLMERMGIEHVRHGGYKWNTIRPTENGQKYPKYYINHSFMFDFKLGEYLVTPIIALAHRYYPFDRRALEGRIRTFNRQFLDRLPEGFFPPDWCHYKNVNWDREGRPREYIWTEAPKYR